jgi:uncharacterized Tic20 family protein
MVHFSCASTHLSPPFPHQAHGFPDILSDVRLLPLMAIILSALVLNPARVISKCTQVVKPSTWKRKMKTQWVAVRGKEFLLWKFGRTFITFVLFGLMSNTSLDAENPFLVRISFILGTVCSTPHPSILGSYTFTVICARSYSCLIAFNE